MPEDIQQIITKYGDIGDVIDHGTPTEKQRVSDYAFERVAQLKREHMEH